MKTIKIELKGNLLNTRNIFMTELKSYINNVNLLITNGNLAAVLSDMVGSKLETYNPCNGRPFKLGELDNLPIMVDPYMRWDDNRIILKNDDLIIEEIEIIDEEILII